MDEPRGAARLPRDIERAAQYQRAIAPLRRQRQALWSAAMRQSG